MDATVTGRNIPTPTIPPAAIPHPQGAGFPGETDEERLRTLAANVPTPQEALEMLRRLDRSPPPPAPHIPVGVSKSDVVRLLRRADIPASPWRLRYAAQVGHIPQPFRTAAGHHAWRVDDLGAIRAYFANPRRPGRPRRGS